MKLSVTGLVLMSWFSLVHAEPLPSPGTIGLLEISGLFGSNLCDPAGSGIIPVYAAPEQAEPVGEIRLEGTRRVGNEGCESREARVYWQQVPGSRPLVTEEVRYGQPGAVVVERQHDWFRILLNDQFAWVKPLVGYRFYSLQELYQTQSTYLSSAWDGRFCSYPGQYRQCAMVAGVPEAAPAVRIIASSTYQGQSWLQVRVLTRGSCGVGEEMMPPSEGWIPAYGLEDKPTVWFYSPGC